MQRAEWAAGKSGGAARFNGEDGYASVPEAASLNITKAITLMAWIKPEEQKQRIPMILFKAGHQGRYILRLDRERHVHALFWKEDAAVTVIRSQEAVPLGWHHVAVTCDPHGSGKVRLYLDGRLSNEKAARQWGDPAGGFLTFSGRGNQAFKGLIDEVRIYSRALTGEEIRRIAGADREPAE
jgi:hypothetical protein